VGYHEPHSAQAPSAPSQVVSVASATQPHFSAPPATQ